MQTERKLLKPLGSTSLDQTTVVLFCIDVSLVRERGNREMGVGNGYLVLALLQSSWSRPWWTVTVAVVRGSSGGGGEASRDYCANPNRWVISVGCGGARQTS